MKSFLIVTCIFLTAVPLAERTLNEYGNYQLEKSREKAIQARYNVTDTNGFGTSFWQASINAKMEACTIRIIELASNPTPDMVITPDLLDYNLRLCLEMNGAFI